MTAKITVIVPVYNVEKYLEECLDSLLSQTYKDIKIVCVNDGSTDDSRRILDEYRKKDARVRVIDKSNGGLSSARNVALKNCDTEFVMFCDSDDSFDKEMCKKMLHVLERDQSDIVVCGTNIVYFTHEEMKKSDMKYYELLFNGKKRVMDEVIINTNVSVSNKIFKMDVIRENKISFPEGLNNEDFYFYNVYMSCVSEISFINEKLYNYVRRDGSIMSSSFKKNRLSLDHLKIAGMLFAAYEKSGFLAKHTDLFWEQWRSSYWFSYEHSSPDMRGRVFEEGKAFVKKNLEKSCPKNDELKGNIEGIFDNKIISLLKRWIVGMYEKINIGYRQQKYINYNIRRLQKQYDDLSRRLDKIINEGACSEK